MFRLLAPFQALVTLVMAMASGPSPDRSLETHRPADVPEVPRSLVAALDVPASAEGSCEAAPTRLFAGALECAYRSDGETFTLTAANGSPEKMARWIVDASQRVSSVRGLRERDHDAWERALGIMARHTIGQSARAFPVDGVLFEDFDGHRGYVFHNGVTFGTFGGPLATCRECACRPVSLHRTQWCTYQAETRRGQSLDECMGELGGDTGWNDTWADLCAANQSLGLRNDFDESYRAFAYFIESRQMSRLFSDPAHADPGEIVAAFERAYARPYAHSPARP